MKNLVLTLALAGATVLGVANVADAAGRDRTWYAGWQQSIDRSNHSQPAPTVTEGRNVAVQAAPVQGVEPYIARQIESNSRSTR